MSVDITTLKARSRPVAVEDLDLSAFRDRPLDPDTLRCLRYMHDVEFHTVCYLRDVLATPAHQDPDVTTFLTLWNLEELYHGEALGAVLAAHDQLAGAERVRRTRRRLRRGDRFVPVGHALASSVVGASYIAVHMTWGAINEWTAQAAYGRLAQRAGHPVLTTLLGRLMRQEGRHASFYAQQARERLADDGRARWLTRTTLRRWWAPVGSTLLPPSEVTFMAHHLFGGDEGRALLDRIDRRVDRLPGLAGVRSAATAMARFGL